MDRNDRFFEFFVNYEYGEARLLTKTEDGATALREFYACANECFGIRKSIGRTTITRIGRDVELPEEFRGRGGTHFLSHHGDRILFDRSVKTPTGREWKLIDEFENVCACPVRGTPSQECDIHGER